MMSLFTLEKWQGLPKESSVQTVIRQLYTLFGEENTAVQCDWIAKALEGISSLNLGKLREHGACREQCVPSEDKQVYFSTNQRCIHGKCVTIDVFIRHKSKGDQDLSKEEEKSAHFYVIGSTQPRLTVICRSNEKLELHALRWCSEVIMDHAAHALAVISEFRGFQLLEPRHILMEFGSLIKVESANSLVEKEMHLLTFFLAGRLDTNERHPIPFLCARVKDTCESSVEIELKETGTTKLIFGRLFVEFLQESRRFGWVADISLAKNSASITLLGPLDALIGLCVVGNVIKLQTTIGTPINRVFHDGNQCGCTAVRRLWQDLLAVVIPADLSCDCQVLVSDCPQLGSVQESWVLNGPMEKESSGTFSYNMDASASDVNKERRVITARPMLHGRWAEGSLNLSHDESFGIGHLFNESHSLSSNDDSYVSASGECFAPNPAGFLPFKLPHRNSEGRSCAAQEANPMYPSAEEMIYHEHHEGFAVAGSLISMYSQEFPGITASSGDIDETISPAGEDRSDRMWQEKWLQQVELGKALYDRDQMSRDQDLVELRKDLEEIMMKKKYQRPHDGGDADSPGESSGQRTHCRDDTAGRRGNWKPAPSGASCERLGHKSDAVSNDIVTVHRLKAQHTVASCSGGAPPVSDEQGLDIGDAAAAPTPDAREPAARSARVNAATSTQVELSDNAESQESCQPLDKTTGTAEEGERDVTTSADGRISDKKIPRDDAPDPSFIASQDVTSDGEFQSSLCRRCQDGDVDQAEQDGSDVVDGPVFNSASREGGRSQPESPTLDVGQAEQDGYDVVDGPAFKLAGKHEGRSQCESPTLAVGHAVARDWFSLKRHTESASEAPRSSEDQCRQDSSGQEWATSQPPVKDRLIDNNDGMSSDAASGAKTTAVITKGEKPGAALRDPTAGDGPCDRDSRLIDNDDGMSSDAASCAKTTAVITKGEKPVAAQRDPTAGDEPCDRDSRLIDNDDGMSSDAASCAKTTAVITKGEKPGAAQRDPTAGDGPCDRDSRLIDNDDGMSSDAASCAKTTAVITKGEKPVAALRDPTAGDGPCDRDSRLIDNDDGMSSDAASCAKTTAVITKGEKPVAALRDPTAGDGPCDRDSRLIDNDDGMSSDAASCAKTTAVITKGEKPVAAQRDSKAGHEPCNAAAQKESSLDSPEVAFVYRSAGVVRVSSGEAANDPEEASGATFIGNGCGIQGARAPIRCMVADGVDSKFVAKHSSCRAPDAMSRFRASWQPEVNDESSMRSRDPTEVQVTHAGDSYHSRKTAPRDVLREEALPDTGEVANGGDPSRSKETALRVVLRDEALSGAGEVATGGNPSRAKETALRVVLREEALSGAGEVAHERHPSRSRETAIGDRLREEALSGAGEVATGGFDSVSSPSLMFSSMTERSLPVTSPSDSVPVDFSDSRNPYEQSRFLHAGAAGAAANISAETSAKIAAMHALYERMNRERGARNRAASECLAVTIERRDRQRREFGDLEEERRISEVEGNETQEVSEVEGSGAASGSPRRPIQESPRWLCEHYQRRCKVRFPCCGKFFPCHRCHNSSEECSGEDVKALQATHIQCVVCKHEQEITEDSHTCKGCWTKLSEYFCPKCKHYTGVEKNPYHCEKCGICRIHKDRSFHCSVCNVCLDKRLEGKHKCRPDSGHDECCICLEDAFSGCQILPCSHKVHRDCAIAMLQNGVRSCPVCRHPLYQVDRNS